MTKKKSPIKPVIEAFLVRSDGTPDEQDVLNRDSFDVNMRLYTDNKYYRCLIQHAIKFLAFTMSQNYENHTDLSSLSGPKLGIPWNIVVYKPSLATQRIDVLINPTIIEVSTSTVTVKTRCACCGIPKEDIQVKRWTWIDVAYYDYHGNHQIKRSVTKTEGGYALQHEIAHCQGILPTQNMLPSVVKASVPEPLVLSET